MGRQRRFTAFQAADHPEVHVCVFWVFFDGGLKQFSCQFEILFLKSEFPTGEHGITMLWVHLQGTIIEFFENTTGVHPDVQSGPTKNDQVVRVRISPGSSPSEVDNFRLPHGRLFGLTTHPRRFDADIPHPDTPRVPREAVHDRVVCGAIFARLILGFCLQQVELFAKSPVFNGFVRDLDAQRMITDSQCFGGIIKFRARSQPGRQASEKAEQYPHDRNQASRMRVEQLHGRGQPWKKWTTNVHTAPRV